jgi:hypothetical protein
MLSSLLTYAGIVLAVLGGVAGVIYLLLLQWAEGAYDALKARTHTQCDIDTFVGPQRNPPGKLKVALVNKLRIGNRQASTKPIPLECTESPHVQGLWVSRAAAVGGTGTGTGTGTTNKATPLADLLPRVTSEGLVDPKDNKQTMVIATIRMGFGHHRLAYSACSWALDQGYTTIFHDLINIESDESKLIGSADSFYSKMSQLSTELGGPVEYMWGKVSVHRTSYIVHRTSYLD